MHYSLVSDSWGKEEVKAINKVIKSNIYTYKGKYVKEFENKFARYFKTNYAVMVNSGSSANLISLPLLAKSPPNCGVVSDTTSVEPALVINPESFVNWLVAVGIVGLLDKEL